MLDAAHALMCAVAAACCPPARISCRLSRPLPSVCLRAFSAEAAAPKADVPPADGVERPSERVQKIVDEVMKLNIFESIQLSKALQVRTKTRQRASAAAEASAGCADHAYERTQI